MIEIIKSGTTFDFVGLGRRASIGSVIFLVLGIAFMFVRGLEYGIDFTGGTMVHIRFPEKVDIKEIRGALEGLSTGEVSVQDFGGASNEFMVRLPESDPELKKGLAQQISKSLGDRFSGPSAFEILRVESVGPRVGNDLRRRALLAVAAATVMMGAYIALRFEFRFGLGAAVALVHDVLAAMIGLAIFGYEFDLNIVAALLTIVGFSVNDTVIISDRVRENLRKNRREPLAAVMNRSINETLSRTILTTGTAILVTLTLFVLGGEMIRGFAFALLVGFLVGTYSTIFIVSPIVLYFEANPRARAPKAA